MPCGQETKQNKNIKQKQYYSKFSKDLKTGSPHKINLKKLK